MKWRWSGLIRSLKEKRESTALRGTWSWKKKIKKLSELLGAAWFSGPLRIEGNPSKQCALRPKKPERGVLFSTEWSNMKMDNKP